MVVMSAIFGIHRTFFFLLKFLDRVCTHIADIDFRNITLYTGNYAFWTQASALILKQKEERNKKIEEKAEEFRNIQERKRR